MEIQVLGMGLNVVDINVSYSTFTNFFFIFVTFLYVFNVFKYFLNVFFTYMPQIY